MCVTRLGAGPPNVLKSPRDVAFHVSKVAIVSASQPNKCAVACESQISPQGGKLCFDPKLPSMYKDVNC